MLLGYTVHRPHSALERQRDRNTWKIDIKDIWLVMILRKSRQHSDWCVSVGVSYLQVAGINRAGREDGWRELAANPMWTAENAMAGLRCRSLEPQSQEGTAVVYVHICLHIIGTVWSIAACQPNHQWGILLLPCCCNLTETFGDVEQNARMCRLAFLFHRSCF